MHRRHAPLLLATAIGTLGTAPAAVAAQTDPWLMLGDLRSKLVADSPLVTEFTQTFTPTGFSTGDTESGAFALDLPDCARWDYEEPFAKSFLLCDNTAYAWNPGETSGRRYELDVDERQGLDLLRLDVSRLRERFEAELAPEGEIVNIHLQPDSDAGQISSADVTLADAGRRLVSISFRDRDGNRTVFVLGDLVRDENADTFTPPDLEWLDD